MKKNKSQKYALGDSQLPGNPVEWSNFLFKIQNALISYGHLEAMSKEYAVDFAYRFSELHGFFENAASARSSKV